MTTGTSINSIFEQPQISKPNKTSTLRVAETKQKGLNISREHATQTSTIQLHDMSTGTAYEPLMTRSDTRPDRSNKTSNKHDESLRKGVDNSRKTELEKELVKREEKLNQLMKEEQEEKLRIEQRLQRLEEEKEREKQRTDDALRKLKAEQAERNRKEEEIRIKEQEAEIIRLQEEKLKRQKEMERIRREEERLQQEQENRERVEREAQVAEEKQEKQKEKKRKKEEMQKLRRKNAGITDQIEQQLKLQGYKPYVDSKGRIFLLDMQGKVVLDAEERPMNLQIAPPKPEPITIIQGVDIFGRPVFINHSGKLIATNENGQPIIDPSGKPVLAPSQPIASSTMGYRPLLDQNGQQVFDADGKPLFLDANGLVILPSAGVYDTDSLYSADFTNTSLQSFDTSIAQSVEPSEQVSDAVLQTIKDYTGSTPKSVTPRQVPRISATLKTEVVTPLKKTKADDSIRLEDGSASPDLTPNVSLRNAVQRPSPAARRPRMEEGWMTNDPSFKAGEHNNAWPQRLVSTDKRTSTGFKITRAVSNDSTASRRSVVSESSEAETVVERQDNIVLTVCKETPHLGFAEFIEEVSSSTSDSEGVKTGSFDNNAMDELSEHNEKENIVEDCREYKEEEEEEEKQGDERELTIAENLAQAPKVKSDFNSSNTSQLSPDEEVSYITANSAGQQSIEEVNAISPVACSSPTEDQEVIEYLSKSTQGKHRVLRTPESIHSLSSSSSSPSPISKNSPKKPTTYDRDLARREFFSVPPLNIESGGELSDNDISRYSVFSDNPPTPPPIISQNVRAKSTSDLYVSPYARRAANRRLLLSTAVPKPYKSFGKVDVKIDALRESIPLPRSESGSVDTQISQMESISEVLGGEDQTFGLIIKSQEDGSLTVKEKVQPMLGAKSTPSLVYNEQRRSFPKMNLDSNFEKLLNEYKSNTRKPIQIKETKYAERELFTLATSDMSNLEVQDKAKEQLSKQTEEISLEANRKLKERVYISSVKDKIGLYEKHTAKEIQDIVTESESEAELPEEEILPTEEVKTKLEALGLQITELDDGSPRRRKKFEVLTEQTIVKVERPHNIDATSISLKGDRSEKSYDLNSSGEYEPDIPQGVKLEGLNYLETSVDDPSSMVLKKSSSSLDKVENVIPISPIRSSRHSETSDIEGNGQKRSSSVPILDESDDDIPLDKKPLGRDRAQSNPYVLDAREDITTCQHWYGAKANKDFVTDVDEILTVEQSVDDLSIKLHKQDDLSKESYNKSQLTSASKKIEQPTMETNIDDYEELQSSYLRGEMDSQASLKSTSKYIQEIVNTDESQSEQQLFETNIDEPTNSHQPKAVSLTNSDLSAENNLDDFVEQSTNLLETKPDETSIQSKKINEENMTENNDSSNDSSLHITERLDSLETNIDDISSSGIEPVIQTSSTELEENQVHDKEKNFNIRDIILTSGCSQNIKKDAVEKKESRLIVTDLAEYSEEPGSGRRYFRSDPLTDKNPLEVGDKKGRFIDPSPTKDDNSIGERTSGRQETDIDDIPMTLEREPRAGQQKIINDEFQNLVLPKHLETNIDDIAMKDSFTSESFENPLLREEKAVREMRNSKNLNELVEGTFENPVDFYQPRELKGNLGQVLVETDIDNVIESEENFSKQGVSVSGLSSLKPVDKKRSINEHSISSKETNMDNLPVLISEELEPETLILSKEILETDLDDYDKNSLPKIKRLRIRSDQTELPKQEQSQRLETNIDDTSVERFLTKVSKNLPVDANMQTSTLSTGTYSDDEIHLIDDNKGRIAISEKDDKIKVKLDSIHQEKTSSASSSSSPDTSDSDIEYKLSEYSEEPGSKRPKNLKLSIVEEESDDDSQSSAELNIAAPQQILRPQPKNKKKRPPLSPLSPPIPDCPPPTGEQRSSFYIIPDSPKSGLPIRPNSIIAQSPISPTIYETDEPAESVENVSSIAGQNATQPVQSSSPTAETQELPQSVIPKDISPIEQMTNISPKRRPKDAPPPPPSGQIKSVKYPAGNEEILQSLDYAELIEREKLTVDSRLNYTQEPSQIEIDKVNLPNEGYGMSSPPTIENKQQVKDNQKSKNHNDEVQYRGMRSANIRESNESQQLEMFRGTQWESVSANEKINQRVESFIEPPILPPSPTEDQQRQLEQFLKAKEESTIQSPKPIMERRQLPPLSFVQGIYRPTDIKFVPGQINSKMEMPLKDEEEYDMIVRSPRTYVESDSHVVKALWSDAMNKNPEGICAQQGQQNNKPRSYEQFAQEDRDIMKVDERKSFFKFPSLSRKSKVKSDDEGIPARGSKTDEEMLSDNDKERSWDASKMAAFMRGRKRSKSKDRESENFEDTDKSFGPGESPKKKSIFKFPTLRKKRDSKTESAEEVPTSPETQPYGIERTVMGSNVERSDTVKEAKRKAGFLSFLKRRNSSNDTISPEKEIKNFINERGQFVNERGILIDERGRMINNRGQLINDDGQLIDDEGRLIDDYGRLLFDQVNPYDVMGRPVSPQQPTKDPNRKFLDSKGRLVNEKGQLINEIGQILDEKGNILDPRLPGEEQFQNNRGQLFNEKGQQVDNYGRLINEQGCLIDGYGRLVNEKGQLINNRGQLIDHNGQLINERGQIINSKGQLVNNKGQLINERGFLVDEQGRLINNKGQLINERGQFVNERGQLLNDHGQPVNEKGELVDKYGQNLPVVALLSGENQKPISPKLVIKETDIDSDLSTGHITEKSSNQNNERVNADKDFSATEYNQVLADYWSKTKPDPNQVRKMPLQSKGSTSDRSSS